MDSFAARHDQYSSARRDGASRPPPAQEALVETMCLAACVDGLLKEGEALALARQIHATPGFETLDREELAETVEQIIRRANAEGIESRTREIGAALAGDAAAREEAYALAMLFVLFDGVIGDEEQSFLQMLQRQLGISDESASRLAALLSEG